MIDFYTTEQIKIPCTAKFYKVLFKNYVTKLLLDKEMDDGRYCR